MRRLVCVKVVDAVRLSDAAFSVLKDISPSDQHKVLRSVEIGQSLRTRGSTTHQKIGLCAQSIVAGIITNMQGNDDRWIGLSADQLGISKNVLRYYLANGDSVLLANLIHITRQIHYSIGDDRDMADALSYVLSSLSNFNIQNTLPGLQQDFLTLWDEIDQEAQNNGVSTKIRDSLRDLYNALNPGTDDTLTTQPVTRAQHHPRPLPPVSNTTRIQHHTHPPPQASNMVRVQQHLHPTAPGTATARIPYRPRPPPPASNTARVYYRSRSTPT